MSGFVVVHVSVVVVFVCVVVRSLPVKRNSYVLRVNVGMWGCALLYAGVVVGVVVVLGR